MARSWLELVTRGARPPPALHALLIFAANLVPAACVLLLGWDVGLLMILYWLENLVVGAVNVLKMGAVAAAGGAAGIAVGLFLIPFFVFHYGLFCTVHGVFVFTLFAGDRPGLFGGRPDPAAAVRADPSLLLNLAALAALHLVLFGFWLAEGRRGRVDLPGQMAAPYGRIVVLHLAILFGGMAALALGQPIWALLLLVLVKTGFDLAAARRPAPAHG